MPLTPDLLAGFSRLLFAPSFNWGKAMPAVRDATRFSALLSPSGSLEPRSQGLKPAESTLKRAAVRACITTPRLKPGAKRSTLKRAKQEMLTKQEMPDRPRTGDMAATTQKKVSRNRHAL